MPEVVVHVLAPHGENERSAPSLFQHDYLVLQYLQRDLAAAMTDIASGGQSGRIAIDIGTGGGPYRAMLESAGFLVKSLDIAPGPGVDLVGSADATGLPADSVDLVLCTQVLEHTRSPWLAMKEFRRILRPCGSAILSAPHVWFHHPHPHDYWRFTNEGMQAMLEEGGLDCRRIQAQGGSAAAFFQVVNFLCFGLAGRWGAPFYLINNLVGRLADSLLRDERFALNHIAVGIKRKQS